MKYVEGHRERAVHARRIGVWGMIVAVLLMVAGCGGTTRLDSPNAGRTLVYEPGLPNFDLEAVATLHHDTPGIDVFVGLPAASLVFLRRGRSYRARYETILRILDEDGRKVVTERAFQDTVAVDDYRATLTFDPVSKQTHVDVDPGTYVVEVSITDDHSEQTVRRRQRVEVVGAESGRLTLGAIRLRGRRGEETAPILSFHVPSSVDSLRAAVYLLNAPRLDSVAVTMRLMRVPSDTATARPPYYLTLIAPRYVRYDRADTLQTTVRTIVDPEPEVEIAFDLPALPEGIYRAEVAVDPMQVAERQPQAALKADREFTVRRPTFPRIATLDDMVDALGYIASDDEVAAIRSAASPEEKKRLFDAFWGRLVTNRQKASDLIERYYSRVEEANRLYTTYKDGWKTDRGMVYIVLGTPIYVDARVDEEVWYYSYDEQDESKVFVFRRRRLYGSDVLGDSYELQRDLYHERAWKRAVDRWRDGSVQ